MTSRPSLSILLLCHNEAVFIRRALRSILEQTFDGPVEILLMDDGSLDDSVALAKAEMARLARPNYHLQVIRSERRLGNAAAFVTALRAARGRYYHVLDGDDFWIDPDKLQKQIAILEADPALAGVAHRAIVRSESDGSESFHPQQEPGKPVLGIEDLLTGGMYFHTSAMLYRNSFYNAATDSTEVPEIFNDVRGDTIRLYVHAFRGGIRYLAQTMSVYDNHRGGIWTGLDWPGKRDLLNNLHTQLAAHGYLSDMGEARAAEFLSERLRAIAAYAPGSLRPISLHPDQVAEAPRQRLTEISRIASLLDLETQLAGLTTAGQYEEALRLVFRFLGALAYDPNMSRLARARRVTSPEIDWHCAHIGGLIGAAAKILPTPPAEDQAETGPVVILVSGMTQDREGMWQQTRDMVALWRGRRRVVVVSTELLPTMPDIQQRLGEDVELLLNTDQGLVEKTAWLIWHLGQLRPAQILVNPARNDVAILAGLRREHAPHIHLLGFHATGYLPGVHSYALDGHVLRRPYDLAWYHRLAPQRAVIHLPHFLDTAPAPVATGGGAPVTATAASTPGAVEGQYDYGLHLIIPVLLKAGALRHVHIGPLSEAMLNRIRKELIRQDFPPAAFVHLPDSGDLAADLATGGASVFLQGFPWSEITPLLVAMAAGLPVIAHRNYLNPALSLHDLCPPGTPEWSDAQQLAAIIGRIGPDWIAAQGAAAQQHMQDRMAGGTTLATALGEGMMEASDPADLPPAPAADAAQNLRHLLSEAFGMTIFRV